MSMQLRASPIARFSAASAFALALVPAVGADARAQVLRERDLGTAYAGGFGFSCANVGDVDVDGIDDFVVGSPYFITAGGVNWAGRAVLYSGATGTMIRDHEGSTNYENLGWSVSDAGDVDGDGVPDYVVGAPGYTTTQSVGQVTVFSGASGAIVWSVTGVAPSLSVGIAVSGIGDVDGDGLGDVVVGTASNEAFVLDHLGQTIHHLTNSDGFGQAVAGAGDLDGDGTRDFLVGKPFADLLSAVDVGGVIAFSGQSGLYLHNLWGSNVGDRLGSTLARIGDVDGDGVDDYLAGSPYSYANGVLSGIVRVVSGAGGLFIREHPGDIPGEFHGSSLCGMSDVDGDGVPDYAIGAINTGPGGVGRVRICSGSSGTTIFEWYGVLRENLDLGSAVAAGDWNGDGVGDLVLGDDTYEDPATGYDNGAVDVMLMAPASWTNYGSGWPGTNGVPNLTALEVPALGAPLDVRIDDSRGANTAALLFIGFQPANVPIRGSGTLLVAPFFTTLLPLPAGGLVLNATLPNDPALAFLDLYLQVLEADPGASKGISFTPGLALRLGFEL